MTTASHASPVLRFLGGARTVTGSRFLVEADGQRVLVDCGLFQGRKELRRRNWAPFPVDPGTIDAVIITHAHVDHVGYLPALVAHGFHGPVFCTPFTRDLASIVLRDSAHLQEEEASFANRSGYSKHHPALPLYTAEDVERTEPLFRVVPYGDRVTVADGMEAVLRPAGHILGSATVEVDLLASSRRILFTGDLGRPQHPLLVGPQPPVGADVVVTESTYGNRAHEPEAGAMELLAEAITETAARGGSIIIPAFAVDRTEVVLMALGRLADEGAIPKLPVYADSPMALAVLDVYRKAIVARSPEIRPEIQEDPFGDPGELHEVASPQESKSLNELHYPSIIVSASGMATGGRILHHLAHRLPDSRNTVVLTGFQAPGTRGQLLADGARSVKMLGQYVPVRADVVHVGSFSVHADSDELIAWLGRSGRAPDVVYAVHGEEPASLTLAERIAEELGWSAVVPMPDEIVRLD